MHGRGMEGGMGGNRECMREHSGGMTQAWDGVGGHVGWHWKSIKDAWGDTKGCMGGMGGT